MSNVDIEWWAKKNGAGSICWVDKGVKYHIEHEASCVIGKLIRWEDEEINCTDEFQARNAPKSDTHKGRVFKKVGIIGSWIIGVNSQFITLPLQIAPIDRRIVGRLINMLLS